METLAAGCSCSRCRLRVLRHADMADEFVIVHGWPSGWFGLVRAARIENLRLVHRAISLLGASIVHSQGDRKLVPLWIHRAQFDGDASDLLRLVFARDGELNVVPLTHAAEHVDFFVIASDQSAQLAARHLEVALGPLEIRLDVIDAAIYGVQVIRTSLGGELILYVCVYLVYLGQLLRVFLFNLGLFIAGFLQITLSDPQSLLHDSEIALQAVARGVCLCQLLFQRGHLLAAVIGSRLHLTAKGLLCLLQLRGVVPGQSEPRDRDDRQNHDRRSYPPWYPVMFLHNLIRIIDHKLFSPSDCPHPGYAHTCSST